MQYICICICCLPRYTVVGLLPLLPSFFFFSSISINSLCSSCSC
uniref:Uncharacterized protein n=1 Tax=Arundo donax TaxID=35708 RepID=A0A0A9BQX9_ARUDO